MKRIWLLALTVIAAETTANPATPAQIVEGCKNWSTLAMVTIIGRKSGISAAEAYKIAAESGSAILKERLDLVSKIYSANLEELNTLNHDSLVVACMEEVKKN